MKTCTARLSVTFPVNAAGSTGIDLLVGVFDGGSGCDDLSGIPIAPPTNQVVETLFPYPVHGLSHAHGYQLGRARPDDRRQTPAGEFLEPVCSWNSADGGRRNRSKLPV